MLLTRCESVIDKADVLGSQIIETQPEAVGDVADDKSAAIYAMQGVTSNLRETDSILSRHGILGRNNTIA